MLLGILKHSSSDTLVHGMLVRNDFMYIEFICTGLLIIITVFHVFLIILF